MKKLFGLLIISLLCSLPGLSQRFGKGCLYDENRYEKIPMTAPLMRGDKGLPSSVSLRDFCPPPGDQGLFGTCTAWASAYASRSILLKIRAGEDSETPIFSPSFVYNQIRLTEDCEYGVYISDALELLKNEGCLSYNDFGYECGRDVTPTEKSKARKFIIKDYKRLFGKQHLPRTQILRPIKKALSEERPVIISMRCYGSLEDARDVWNPTEPDIDMGCHAMTVVGYDDAKYGGAFQLMNSWGTAWGIGGFTWVRYSDFEKYCMEAYETVDFMFGPEAAAGSYTFGGKMRFVTSEGKEMAMKLKRGIYQTNRTYYAGSSFRFYISHTNPVYMYAIGTDLSGECSRIFPADDSVSPILSYKTGTVAFPGEQDFVQLDDRSGKDYVCVLYSLQPLDIKEIIAKMEKLRGPVSERLEKAVGKEKMVKQIRYDKKGKVGFKASADEKKKTHFVVPLIVEIKHG